MTTVTLEQFNLLVDALVANIEADEYFNPDVILALSTGGFPLAAVLAKRLGISGRYVAGISTFKEGVEYYLGAIVSLGDLSGLNVLVVDDASDRGKLTAAVAATVISMKGNPRTAVLLANKDGIQPDYIARQCDGKPPKFFWENSD